uniref:tryptase n=1 Tax=Suricata suricatta TaxID=37032 RepID=A0A673U4L9_SURSU
MTRHWPWEVSLRLENEHVCGGALIDLSWAVTAAHCIQGTKEYSVILGTAKLRPTDFPKALSIPVRDIIMHPKYWGRTFITGDVALLQLQTPATFSKYVQPICLPEASYHLKVGTQCWVTGWGQVKQRFSEPWFQACGHTNIACKMVKGKLVEVGKWPWQVSIFFLGAYICSGSLIHHQWVLTAAHCLQRSKDPKQYSVSVGVQHLPENGTRLLLTHIVIHEDFHNLISRDIALLKLRDPISWSPLIQPVCLPNAKFKPSPGTMCWVIGWRHKNEQGTSKTPYSLQEVAVKIINNDICHQKYQFLLLKEDKKFIGKDMLCGSSELGTDSCQANSGSPLVCQVNSSWVQIGLVSWRYSCTRRGFPGIYTSTSHFTYWIKKRIGDMRFISRAGPTFLSQTPAQEANVGRRRERSLACRRCCRGMEPQCGTRARRQAPQDLRASAFVLLLLLLLRPTGCPAGQTPGTPSEPPSANAGVPCAPTATCPSGGPRLPRQAPTILSQPSTLETSPVSKDSINLFPTCGSSYEEDPTLRDPEAMARRWPWMVSVRANGTHVCAGTLIASQWVLTVAHCLSQNDFIYSVRAGSPRMDQTSQTTADVPVLQVIVNNRYQSRRHWSWVGRTNDIALLKLAWVLKYNKYVWPVCLPGLDFEVKDHSVCTVTGWGHPRADAEGAQRALLPTAHRPGLQDLKQNI